MGYPEWVDRKDSKCTLKDMKAHLKHARPRAEYGKGVRVHGHNRMGSYDYTLSQDPADRVEQVHCTFKLKSGRTRRFEPHLHPREMLESGIFSGKMINDCMDEFPREWFEKAIKAKKLSPEQADDRINAYGIASRQSLGKWRRNGWIHGDDERGWFQWYCRYVLGRRMPTEDRTQMRRWRSIARWYGVMKAHPERMKVKQALLHWSWPQT